MALSVWVYSVRVCMTDGLGMMLSSCPPPHMASKTGPEREGRKGLSRVHGASAGASPEVGGPPAEQDPWTANMATLKTSGGQISDQRRCLSLTVH
jgi:hypothetical protein